MYRRQPRVRARRLGVALVAVVALASACTSGGGGDNSSEPPSPSTSGPVAAGPPSLRAVTVGPPVWAAPRDPIATFERVIDAGTALVGTGRSSRDSAAPLTGFDPATGAVRWSVQVAGDFPGGDGSAWIEDDPQGAAGSSPHVLMHYYSPDCTRPAGTCPADGSHHGTTPEHGILALSPTTGQVQWQRALIPSVAEGSAHDTDWQGATARVVGVRNGIVVVVAAQSTAFDGDEFAEADRTHSFGVDIVTGAVRWTVPGFIAYDVAGTTVLGRSPDAAGIDRTLAAVDLTTGAPRWVASGALAQAPILAVSARAVAVRTAYDAPVTFLDTAHGRMLSTSRTVSTCAADDTMIACSTPTVPTRLLTLAGTETIARISVQAVSGGYTLSAVHSGYVVLTGTAQSLLVERTGSPRASLPGRVLLFGDDRVYTVTSTLVCYPLR